METLYDHLFYHPPVDACFSSEAHLGAMLRFEAALAAAQARHGLIPEAAADAIGQCCTLESLDPGAIARQTGLAGNPCIPLVKQLTDAVRRVDPEAARYVHLGATSQDVIDSALMLRVQESLALMREDLNQVIDQLTALTRRHRDTVMIGRSFLQHARPVTFGFKTAGWLDSLLGARDKLDRIYAHHLFLQFGGAVGTLAGLPEKGLDVARTLSEMLGLRLPTLTWHTRREPLAEIATVLGLLSGSLGKIAKDVSLLMQTEVAEVFEPAVEGKGGSSTMPHKRNPVYCTAILANARRVPALVAALLGAMVQDHERATGEWHAEWETLTGLIRLSAGALRRSVELTGGLTVDAARMRRNIELTGGLIYAENVTLALAPAMGKAAAHELLEQLCAQAQAGGRHLKEVVSGNEAIASALSPGQIDALFDAERATGYCREFVEQVLNK